MTDKILNTVNAAFSLEKKDAGEFARVKANGMTFDIEWFYARGLGNVSRLSASGMLGLMKMDTVIVNPFEVDAPLFSYDRIFAMGNDTLIVELYDTRIAKAELIGFENVAAFSEGLPKRDLGAHWYDNIKLSQSVSFRGKKKNSAAFDRVTEEFLSAYLKNVALAKPCDKAEKRKKASEYAEGLLANGGPSTDAFKKFIGEEKTAELFRRIVFGTAD